jgi:hypothetical protein
VGALEDAFLLHAHPDEAVDVEEAAVVTVAVVPVDEPVVLRREHLGGVVVEARVAGDGQLELAEAQHDAGRAVGGGGQREQASRERLARAAVEQRQAHLAPRLGRAGVPVDVEHLGDLALAAPGEHVAPPATAHVGGEVVGDDVHAQAETGGDQCLEQRGEAGGPAELPAQRRRVRAVVAVGAGRHRLGDR